MVQVSGEKYTQKILVLVSIYIIGVSIVQGPRWHPYEIVPNVFLFSKEVSQ